MYVLIVPEVLVYTVATEETDGFRRYLESAKEFNINPTVLGFGETWKGGEIRIKPGGGWKVKLLKEALRTHQDQKDKIVLFTDGYDVIFVKNMDYIIQKFEKSGAKVLFSAEPYCWPDKNLASKYPEVEGGNRYLNSGLYMGYVPEILKVLEREELKDDDDDQLYFTNAYLDEKFREEVNMRLDNTNEIFQNLNGAACEYYRRDVCFLLYVKFIENFNTILYNTKNF